MIKLRFFLHVLLTLGILLFGLRSVVATPTQAQADVITPQPAASQLHDRARPLLVAPDFNLESKVTLTRPVINPAGTFVPDLPAPPTDTGSGQPASLDPKEAAHLDRIMPRSPAAGPDAANACSNAVKNGGFEANTSWYVSSTTNAMYINQYYYLGARSFYMTTKNGQSPYFWQPVQIPSQAASMFVRFRAVAFLDSGDTAIVSLWNATWTQRLWSGAVPVTQNGWTDLYWWLPQSALNGLLNKTVNFTFEMYQDGDINYSDLYLDEVVLGVCDTPAPTPDPTAGTRTINLDISLYKTPTLAERQAYEEIIRYAADGIYEMSNGRHFLGNVTLYQNDVKQNSAHVRWIKAEWPKAALNGYYKARTADNQLHFGDYFGTSNLLDPTLRKRAGYIIAHEFGHYYYGLADEYRATSASPCSQTYPVCPRTTDLGVDLSVMNDQYLAENGDLRWLNFSIPYYNTRQNAQDRVYGASAWETLVRLPNQDPPQALKTAGVPRQYFLELTSVAPKQGQLPSTELNLPGGQTQARSRLSFNWIAPSLNPTVADLAYEAQVHLASGSTVDYPQPALLVATLANGDLIARAGLQAVVTAPDNSTSALTLKDDGVAPDEFADDGRYSGIMPYTQNGIYQVSVTFNNAAGQAAFTTIGLADGPWALGSLVGEALSATATTTVTVQNVTADDHSDKTQGATPITTDNLPHAARIDRPGDHDFFEGTLLGSGKFVLRLANFARGMQPHIRFLAADGITLLGDFHFAPEPGYYYIFYVTGEAGASLFIDIAQTDPQADAGSYEISFGRPLQGEIYYNAYLPALTK